MELKEGRGLQTYLKPESFTDLINYHPRKIGKIDLNEPNKKIGRFYHIVEYNGKIFTILTKTEIFEI